MINYLTLSHDFVFLFAMGQNDPRAVAPECGEPLLTFDSLCCGSDGEMPGRSAPKKQTMSDLACT